MKRFLISFLALPLCPPTQAGIFHLSREKIHRCVHTELHESWSGGDWSGGTPYTTRERDGAVINGKPTDHWMKRSEANKVLVITNTTIRCAGVGN